MTDDPRVALKLAMLDRAGPGDSAAVFGDMYVVEGAYTKRCLELGFKRVLLIDSLETPGWQRARLEHPELDFYKGDFSNALFMHSIRETFDVTVYAGLYPLTERSPEYNEFDPLAVNQSSWIWGMTPSFQRNVLAGEGFAPIAEQSGPDLPNPQRFWCGCVVEHGEQNPQYWSRTAPPPGLYEPHWQPAS